MAIPNIGGGCPEITSSENINWHNQFGKTSGNIQWNLKKKMVCMLYRSAISFFGINCQETKCSPIFIAIYRDILLPMYS